MNIRTVVHAHLTRERLDVLIAVLAPLVLMLESGYACGWMFANGDLTLTNPNTYLALGRGIFLEGLIFAMFKLVRVSAHTFRHTFARMYLEQGGEIYKLSRLMGHSSVEVTEEYLKDFNVRSARQEQDKFSPVNTLDLLGKRTRGKGKKGKI